MAIIHAFDFDPAKPQHRDHPVVGMIGNERFLRRLAHQHMRVADSAADFIVIDGGETDWPTVHDHLAAGSLFSTGAKSVILDNADEFNRRHRDRLEQYLDAPSPRNRLVLPFDTLAKNTRLFKAIDRVGLIVECSLPEQAGGRGKLDQKRLRAWLDKHAGEIPVELTQDGLDQLIDLTGWELGLIDQELHKLSLFYDGKKKLKAEHVQQVVGGWRTESTWDMLEAVVAGDADRAIKQLDELLQAGESPQRLFGSMTWSLRRFAEATRIFERSERRGNVDQQIAAALVAAGIRNWAPVLDPAVRAMKQLSRERTRKLYRWLLETDLALKGSHSNPVRSRFALEQIIFRLAKQARPK